MSSIRTIRLRRNGAAPNADSPLGSLTIRMPILNDWACAARLLPLPDAGLFGTAGEIYVVPIDDGSSTPATDDIVQAPLVSIFLAAAARWLDPLLRHNAGQPVPGACATEGA